MSHRKEIYIVETHLRGSKEDWHIRSVFFEVEKAWAAVEAFRTNETIEARVSHFTRGFSPPPVESEVRMSERDSLSANLKKLPYRDPPTDKCSRCQCMGLELICRGCLTQIFETSGLINR